MTCVQHCSIVQNSTMPLKILCVPPIYPALPPTPGSHSSKLSPQSCLFQNVKQLESYSWNIAFSDWPLSLSDMHLNFLHIFSWLCNSFHFSTKQYSIVWMYHSLVIHSPTEGHLGCFQVLTVTNKATATICMQVFVYIYFQLLWVNTKEHSCCVLR